ncbi:hypothetical protein LEP1GSC202_3018 [Leptospira yanagawae serovar Saopaulo str. Sao Paulo = ATCC 700523]|uniref:Uncharacterized protein n=1 Tax=Leptospira yanagawae serovar Saopaulo str. Sao Paulo = ATCC 700523 TaxID=1249483 RepID=A0A5E8HCG5_9LEPT|nr:hypothetical protein LEP1GSC202_3018 [Leptospira yanagawae serovar Saopaulo str. Sao Paulo = ATCC 700523]
MKSSFGYKKLKTKRVSWTICTIYQIFHSFVLTASSQTFMIS